MNSRITCRQIIPILFIVLVASAAAMGQKVLPHRWQAYTAPDSSFKIELPGDPSVETAPFHAANEGTKAMVSVNVKASESTAYGCTYAYIKIPPGSANKFLEVSRQESLRKLRATVIREKRLTVQGYPALEMTARAEGNWILDERLVVVGQRVYVITGTSTIPADREPKVIRRVFDSFKVIHP